MGAVILTGGSDRWPRRAGTCVPIEHIDGHNLSARVRQLPRAVERMPDGTMDCDNCAPIIAPAAFGSIGRMAIIAPDQLECRELAQKLHKCRDTARPFSSGYN